MFGDAYIYILLILFIADIYIFFCFIRRLTHKNLLRALWFLPLILIAAAVYLIFVKRYLGEYRDFFTLIYMALALPKIIFTTISLLDIPLRLLFRWRFYPFTTLALLSAAGALFIVVYGATVGTTRFKVREVSYESKEIPKSFDGYKIVQVSDLHLGNWKDKRSAMEKMVSIINNQNGDAVMITGDIVHHRATEFDGVEDILSRIEAKDRVFSVMGNHDYGSYRRFKDKEEELQNLKDIKLRQSKMGWRMLNNEHSLISRGEDKIAIIGVENGGSQGFADYSNLPAAMRGTANVPFKILLSHDPTHWRKEVLGTGIDITLSGHTHAGQFILFGFSFASTRYNEWGGCYIEGDQMLYVNVGAGQTGLAFRFGAWPEVTVITLKSLQ